MLTATKFIILIAIIILCILFYPHLSPQSIHAFIKANSVAAPELLTTFDLAAFVRKAEHRTVQARAVRATRQADTLTEAKAATLTGWRR